MRNRKSRLRLRTAEKCDGVMAHDKKHLFLQLITEFCDKCNRAIQNKAANTFKTPENAAEEDSTKEVPSMIGSSQLLRDQHGGVASSGRLPKQQRAMIPALNQKSSQVYLCPSPSDFSTLASIQPFQ